MCQKYKDRQLDWKEEYARQSNNASDLYLWSDHLEYLQGQRIPQLIQNIQANSETVFLIIPQSFHSMYF
jgi:hypothetical protein